MLSTRPILQLRKTKFDKIVEGSTFFCLAAGWITIAVLHKSLPAIIPIHYDMQGNIDRYGAKEIIWILPLIFTVVLAGIYYLNKHPHLFNYMVEINETNAETEYRGATRLIRVIQLGVAVIFLVLVIDIMMSAKTGKSFLGVWFIPAVLLTFIIPVIITMLSKNSKSKSASAEPNL